MKFKHVVAVASLLALAGCGAKAAPQPQLKVLESIAQREGNVDRVKAVNTSIAEAMPTFVYTNQVNKKYSLSDIYVRGDVVGVEPGHSYDWEMSSEPPKQIELKFEDRSSVATTYLLKVRITKLIVSAVNTLDENRQNQIAVGKTITVGVNAAGSGYLSELQNEWVGKKSIAVLLETNTAMFENDDSVWAVLGNGQYLGIVSGGSATFDAAVDVATKSPVSIAELESFSGSARLKNVNGFDERVD